MKYIVLELQVTNGQVANLVTAHDDLPRAWSKYHTVLAAAAVSGLDSHAAVLMEDSGETIAHECFTAEPEEGADES